MTTIIANATIHGRSYDASGPLLAIQFEATDETIAPPMLIGYICGPAAEQLWNTFFPGSKRSIEFEPLLGFEFGRIVSFGIRRVRYNNHGEIISQNGSRPFSNRDEYDKILYLHTRPSISTFMACFPPSNYSGPGTPLPEDLDA